MLLGEILLCLSPSAPPSSPSHHSRLSLSLALLRSNKCPRYCEAYIRNRKGLGWGLGLVAPALTQAYTEGRPVGRPGERGQRGEVEQKGAVRHKERKVEETPPWLFGGLWFKVICVFQTPPPLGWGLGCSGGRWWVLPSARGSMWAFSFPLLFFFIVGSWRWGGSAGGSIDWRLVVVAAGWETQRCAHEGP